MKWIKFFLTFWVMGTLLFGADFEYDPELVCALEGKKLIVTRQAHSTNNELDIVTSSASPFYHLTKPGRLHVKDQAKAWKDKGITTIYSSPVYRALQSAEIFGRYFELTLEHLVAEPRLRMQHFGDSEGVDFDVYKAQFASFEEMLEGHAPGGERGRSVYRRIRNFLYSVARSTDTHVLIITHAFNYCHIKKILTGEYGELPEPSEFIIYDFTH